MAGQCYGDQFKEQALALVARQDKPASVIARELGIRRKTLYKWRETARRQPAEPFIGSGISAPTTNGSATWNARSAISKRRTRS